MELVFVARAVRRYWWLTAAIVVGAVVAALMFASGRTAFYQSESLVLVAPADESAFAGTASDRFVQNQLVVFESELLAQRVADSLEGLSLDEVRNSVAFEQIAGTDVVAIRVQSSSAELAQVLADAFAGAYLDVVRDQQADARRPQLEVLEQDIEDTAVLLADLNDEAERIIAQFLAQTGEVGQVLPSLEQVAPGLSTERDAVRERYFELLAARNTLVDELARLETTGQFVQGASPPIDQTTGPLLLILAGLFAGAVIGTLAAFGLARTSPRVLDVDEVAQRLGVPVAGAIPKDAALARREALLETPLSSAAAPVIRELCVRAEARGAAGSSLKVVVAGADRDAGTTTLAVEIAKRFSIDGQVLLVDASTASPELSRVIAPGIDGVARFLRTIRAPRTARSSSAKAKVAVADAPLDGLRVTGLGDGVEQVRIQRGEAAPLVQALEGVADVIVFDVGRLMSAASSLQLAEFADVVLLAVPMRHQRSESLSVVAAQLKQVPGTVLPVITPAHRSRAAWRRPVSTDRPPDTAVSSPTESDTDTEDAVTPQSAAGGA
jgi:capsular polysaccharide biosynthesis protein